MTTYRSKQTISAVQFQGQPIPGVTCDGSSPDKDTREVAKFANGCDSSRAHLLHVHTKDTGGMKVLKPSDWIFPVEAGPFGVADDVKFRAHWEVPAPVAEPVPEEPIVETVVAAPAPPKTLDELLAEAGLPSAEEIKAVMADEAAGRVQTPDTPAGTDARPLAEELQQVEPPAGSMIFPDAPIDHVEA